ncbi:putative ABC transporter ATP-binding protein [Spirochaetia bacterium]|nr:putative ABC transporter ATP-binding protein [Spirochaetia bacterium]
MKKPVAVFENFSFQYKAQNKPTLADINLTIYQGEKVLILGASGSGKSTLANCINGLIPFSYPGTIGGSCKVNGDETRSLSVFELSRAVGTVLQDSDAQFVGLSVGEDIAFSMENDLSPREKMREEVWKNALAVGMENMLGALPFHLSGGQKQKTALAGVLGKKTNILIFDEPLASLDPVTGTVAIDLIDKITKEYQYTTIIIEHRFEDVLFRPVDRVILLDQGKIVADTTADTLLRGDMLAAYGIREPHYISAMKYAGCDLATVPEIDKPDTLQLNEDFREKLMAFFRHEEKAVPKEYGEELIRAEGVSCSYDLGGGLSMEAIKNVSFSVCRGERIAFIGKNGAGKSTMAKLICGICRPSKGAIYLGGEDYKHLSVTEIGGKAGYVMQDPNQMLVKDIIKDEVELGLRLRLLPGDEISRRAQAAMETCELYRMRNWPTGAVSYGQRKRITVASVLAQEPDLIIMDEPSAGQDYRHYMEIIGFINRINATLGKTIIFITHDMYLAIENTDRAVVFADGNIIADGNIFAILSDSRIVAEAHLKQTSLHILAEKLGLPGDKCIERFISYERGRRE